MGSKHANETSFKPGEGGRPKGVPNKFTTLKQAFVNAFTDVGGEEYIKKFAKQSKNSRAFLQMMSMLLPKDVQLSGSDGGPLESRIVVVLPSESKPKQEPSGSSS